MSQIVKNVSHTTKDALVDQIRDIFDLWGTDFSLSATQISPSRTRVSLHTVHSAQFHIVRDILLHMRHNFYFLGHNLLQPNAINPFLGLIIVYVVYRDSYIRYLT